MSWERVALEDVCEVVGGATPKTGEPEFWGGDVPWVTPADLTNLKGVYISETPRRLTTEGLRSCAAKVLPANSVLLSSRAPIGHVAINTVPMATNQGFKSFIPDRSRLDEKYLFWWLVSNKAALQRLGVGATFKEISKAIVSRVVILLPPLPEQRRIASILDEAQTLRRLAESRVVLLEDMVRSAFRATQASASLARVRLSDIAEVVGGSTPKSGVAELWDGDIPWITPADLSKNADLVISKTARTISDQGLRSIGNRLLPPGAVLLSSRAPIGLVGIVGVPMATNQGFKSLIPDAEIVDSTYLYWWLRANRATLERRGVGATFKELSKTVVESIELALPPIEEQREFGRLARDAEEARLRAVASLRQVQLLTDSLQARAIRGEL
ncbi:restriction endonuclease subunit S [Microcella frigidaquae]|nr:restriction endonuclease subunit S [Microcella frigidaquae]NHN45239.1 hypothetical protein [Microcella frigidaquae]